MSDYDIGYGKPPKASRFKKGKSGNPKGRPKGRKNFSTILIAELSEKLTIKEAGKSKKLTKIEAVVKQLVTRAINGDARAMAELMRQIAAHWPEEALGSLHSLPPTEEDLELLEDFVRRSSNRGGGQIDGT
ncbi:DUF5681 domain-containing protein [Hyphobacterium sp. HN65]|uniref:DUF5681 domain-containing protein n=1 Tax=Hyphobacterium lacteum TaxID=3116575 RepID=A0ABU7LPK4_9PROT|nr:DUF5681 domain-containing protein [Hyphobacterium sp. HN65]MEE2525844.1 DUF5681 domain-containing protein [Hyphobacterium sp. HN65]